MTVLEKAELLKGLHTECFHQVFEVETSENRVDIYLKGISEDSSRNYVEHMASASRYDVYLGAFGQLNEFLDVAVETNLRDELEVTDFKYDNEDVFEEGIVELIELIFDNEAVTSFSLGNIEHYQYALKTNKMNNKVFSCVAILHLEIEEYLNNKLK